ncbi:MAG: AAA family ATPase, partial [Chloroflexi bacterium]|nr:AAA family ATPase [Chloroflexota bacterium]
MDSLTGTVERITFYNADNGYSVIKIKPSQRYPSAEARDGTIAVVGTMPELAVGEQIQLTGQWVDDARYGRQFRCETVTPLAPTTEDGIVSYLSSGIVKGIGRRTAEKIVRYFGIETLDVLDNQPDRLSEVPGLKRELARDLAQAWAYNQAIRQTMIFLQGYGVSSKMAARIYEHYGAESINVVKEDPFTLADEVYGIGFLRADVIAQNMGIKPDAMVRVRAGLSYALSQLSREGHVYVPRPELIERTGNLLRVDNPDLITDVLTQQLFAGELIADGAVAGDGVEAIYLPLYYHAEKNAAEALRRLVNTPSRMMLEAEQLDWPEFLTDLAEENNVQLTDQQQGAVRAALTNKVSVLTGGPGTGKTTTLRMVIQALDAQ